MDLNCGNFTYDSPVSSIVKEAADAAKKQIEGNSHFNKGSRIQLDIKHLKLMTMMGFDSQFCIHFINKIDAMKKKFFDLIYSIVNLTMDGKHAT